MPPAQTPSVDVETAIELRPSPGFLVGTADGVEVRHRGAGARCDDLTQTVHRTACAPLQTRPRL